MFHFNRPDDLATLIVERFADIIWMIVMSGLVIGIPLMLVVLATQTAVGGINFAPKALSFKGNRINPLSGLKRIFSAKGLMELVKAVLKVTLLIGIAAVIIYIRLPTLLQLPSRDLESAFMRGLIEFPVLLGALLIVLAIIFAIDYFWQRHVHIQSLRMTKQEQKDEYKQTEGSPEVKAKIRRMQMETASNAGKQQKALDDVPNATAVITNPTHFAVALKYEVGTSDAPIILAMGRGYMAAQIIERAKGANVTVFRAPLLARALYFTGDIGAHITEQLYQAVAIVLAYLYRLDKGEMVEEPEIVVPDELQFTENGSVIDGKKPPRGSSYA